MFATPGLTRRVAAPAVLLSMMHAAYAQQAEPAQPAAAAPTVVVEGKRPEPDVDARVRAAKSRMGRKFSNRRGQMSFYLPPTSPGAPSPMIIPLAERIAGARGHILQNDQSLAEAFKAYDSKDYTRAAELFKEAYSKVGYDDAALMLGRIYLYGLGTTPDAKQAIHWFEEVADGYFTPGIDEQRFNPKAPMTLIPLTEASFTLARMYEEGFGVDKDPAKARRWYQKTADLGYVPALSILGKYALAGTAGTRDAAKALAYFKEAAELGYVPAMYYTGKLYYQGDDGVPQDFAKAAAWFDAAARAGHAGAMFAAGRMYDLGQGVAADKARAAVFFKEAALKGQSDAQYALGTYFYEGGTVQQNQPAARQLFEAAAKQGQPEAMFNLGAMAARGEGGARDPVAAYVWLSRASASGNRDAPDALAAVAPGLTQEQRIRALALLAPPTEAH